MLVMFAADSVEATLTGPVNDAPVNAAPSRFVNAPDAVEAPVPPAVIETVLVPDSTVPVPL